jgi:hypothetical protein
VVNTNRRNFLFGSLAVAFTTALPSISFASYNQDIVDVIESCHLKFENAEYIGDWMHIFIEEMEKKMKVWGTYEPLKEMRMFSYDETGKIVDQGPSGWWTNPNFTNECHMTGHWGNYDSAGFTLDFKNPKGNWVNVRYHWQDKSFKIKERGSEEV